MDLIALFRLETPALEIFIRGSTIYWFIFLLLRLAGRRDIGSVGVADLLVLVLIADAASGAMTGDSKSLGDGMAVVASIFFWSVLVDRVGYFFPSTRRWLTPNRVCLISNGELQRRGMRREYITEEELMAELRLKGIDKVENIRDAYMESNGKISVIQYK